MTTKLHISHILVPCTNKKRTKLGEPVYYRDCRPGTPSDWVELLSKKESPVAPASKVYSGGSWYEIMQSRQLAPSASFSVISAGYGLMEIDTPISSYQATFQSGSPDSVGRGWKPQKEANRNWWEAISGSDWFLKFSNSKGIVLFQLSVVYLHALMPGLVKLGELIGDKLMIICPGYALKESPLSDYFLPIDTRFESITKCSRSQLGASSLKWVLSNYPSDDGWNVTAVKESILRITNNLPDVIKYNRIFRSDEDILNFIEEHHKRFDKPTPTPLLKILRASNYACEQNRFSKLFTQWKGLNRSDQ